MRSHRNVKREEFLVGRRNFLSKAAAIAASVPAALTATEAAPPQEPAPPAKVEIQTTDRPGSDICAFLKSIPAPAAVKDIPLLNQ